VNTDQLSGSGGERGHDDKRREEQPREQEGEVVEELDQVSFGLDHINFGAMRSHVSGPG
jgi:hypothetical protein